MHTPENAAFGALGTQGVPENASFGALITQGVYLQCCGEQGALAGVNAAELHLLHLKQNRTW